MLTPYKDIGGIIEKTNLPSLRRQGYNDSAELVTASDSELETNGLRPPAIRRLRRALFMLELCPWTMSELLLRACLSGVLDALEVEGYETAEDLADADDATLTKAGLNAPEVRRLRRFLAGGGTEGWAAVDVAATTAAEETTEAGTTGTTAVEAAATAVMEAEAAAEAEAAEVAEAAAGDAAQAAVESAVEAVETAEAAAVETAVTALEGDGEPMAAMASDDGGLTYAEWSAARLKSISIKIGIMIPR